MSSRSNPVVAWTLRLQGIAIDATEETIIQDLRHIGESSELLKPAFKDLIVAQDAYYSCATIIVQSPNHPDELTREFAEQSSKAGREYSLDNSFEGITPLAEDKDGVDCDIVAVPGLSSHALGSWKSRQSQDVWLRDWLPHDIPKTRVLLYGYDTRLEGSTVASSLGTLSSALLESLTTFRRDTKTLERPILFIGHSLGGLLVKEALVQSLRDKSPRPYKRQLRLAARGMVFFGVPHWGMHQDALMTAVKGLSIENLVHSIVMDRHKEASDYLDRLTKDFAESFDGETRLISVYERRASKTIVKLPDGTFALEGPEQLLVTKDSALQIGTAGRIHEQSIPFQTDHSNLVKFNWRNDDRYKIIKRYIEDLVEDARWRPSEYPQAETPFLENHQPRLLSEADQSHQSHWVHTGNTSVGDGSTVNIGSGNHNTWKYS